MLVQKRNPGDYWAFKTLDICSHVCFLQRVCFESPFLLCLSLGPSGKLVEDKNVICSWSDSPHGRQGVRPQKEEAVCLGIICRDFLTLSGLSTMLDSYTAVFLRPCALDFILNNRGEWVSRVDTFRGLSDLFTFCMQAKQGVLHCIENVLLCEQRQKHKEDA